jgi:hypothetical protein
VVEKLGEGTSSYSVGDDLFGQLLIAPPGSAGTYAEYVAVSEDAPLARVPSGLDGIVAAALLTAGGAGLAIVDQLDPLADKTVTSWCGSVSVSRARSPRGTASSTAGQLHGGVWCRTSTRNCVLGSGCGWSPAPLQEPAVLGFETADVVDAVGGDLSGSVVGGNHS